MSRIVRENGKYYKIPLHEDIIRWAIPISVTIGTGALIYNNVGDDTFTKVGITSALSLPIFAATAIATNHGMKKIIGKKKSIKKKRSIRRNNMR